MIKFPLYPIRSYERIFTEGPYKCIETARNRYVLDNPELKESCYTKRRLRLLDDKDKPYQLYPINFKIDSLIQLVGLKARIFYTNEGKLTKWKKEKYFKVNTYLVMAFWVSETDKKMVKVHGISYPIQVDNSYVGQKYVKLVELGKQRLFYGCTNNKVEPPYRIKI